VQETALVVAASVIALAWAAQRATGRVLAFQAEREARRNPPPAEPVCGCGHNVSFHEDDGRGPCHQVEHITALEQRPIADEHHRPLINQHGYYQTRHALVQVARELCHCQGYSGPPRPESFATARVLDPTRP
jgi:hypothetical protein